MKKLAFTLILPAVFIFSIPSGLMAQAETAVEHMDKAIGTIEDLKNETWQYLKSVTKGKGARKVEKKREELLAAIKTQKANANRLKGYKSDDRLKNAVVNYLDLSQTVLKEDFDKILDMEDIAEQSYDAMEAYLLAKEQASRKLNDAFESVVQAQKDFAAANDIKLLEAENDKLSQRIHKASETLAYYNEIYLIFFKSYKQEAYVMDALGRQDVSGVEQNNNTLLSFTNEGLKSLNDVAGFRGDASLKTAAQQMLKFYKKEAETDFPAMVDFYIKKDNFEKSQKTMEAKSKKDRTQDDIDKFNAAANEFNQAVTTYNKINDAMNKDRAKYLTEWNQKSEKFFDLHSN